MVFKKVLDFIRDTLDLLVAVGIGVFNCYILQFAQESLQITIHVLTILLMWMGVISFFAKRFKKNRKSDQVLKSMNSKLKKIDLAQNTVKNGERLGELILKLITGGRKIMATLITKIKTFSGYILAFIGAVVTLIESNFELLNNLTNGEFQIGGENGFVVILGILSFIIALISNHYTTEQKESAKVNIVKEIARVAIIEYEQLLAAGSDALKETGVDTGVYKYSGVTAKIQTACADVGLTYVQEFWDQYIEDTVAVLNATKVTEEVTEEETL